MKKLTIDDLEFEDSLNASDWLEVTVFSEDVMIDRGEAVRIVKHLKSVFQLKDKAN